ncbi:MAG TPA: FHA domain-containing protein, partial [Myxococcota bacterium]|nr:FHA domain-containing protein [Myxococcota bacterium]
MLGRDPHCDLVVEHATVSSRHAELSPSAAGFLFKDLGSTNGSALVRGAATTPCRPGEPVPLVPGDVLLLGDASRPLRVEVEADPTRPA